jgi:hypothetical protein
MMIMFSASTRVCFRYYHGTDGDLRAISSSMIIKNPQVLIYLYEVRVVSYCSLTIPPQAPVTGNTSGKHTTAYSLQYTDYNVLTY